MIMATLLDVTAFKHFETLFPFLLVLVLVYAILIKTDYFKDKQGIAALLAFICGVMMLYSRVAIKTVNLMAPWFVLFIIFAILFVLAFMVLGVSQKQVTDFVASGEWGIGTWIMAIMLIIGVGSLVAVYNEEAPLKSLQEGEGGAVKEVPVSEEYGFWQTLFHPKILGLALILLVAFFTIKFMSKNE